MHINDYKVRQHEIGVMERRTKYPRSSEGTLLPAGMVRKCFHYREGGSWIGHQALRQVSEGTDGGTSHGKQTERYEQGQKLKSTENKQ